MMEVVERGTIQKTNFVEVFYSTQYDPAVGR
jgi:hypothetical protein